MSLQAIKWTESKLHVLDQLLLPGKTEYITVTNVQEGWHVINRMQVRGAPAIAIVGCLSLATELIHSSFEDKDELLKTISDKLQYLVTARPTAVNMKRAADELTSFSRRLRRENVTLAEMIGLVTEWCQKMLEDDVSTNKKIGDFGAESILKSVKDRKVKLLTHCNTGSLATAGYGTALGVVRSIYGSGQLAQAYCTETRPYNQGARLTAYELVFEKMPGVLICDSMAGALMNNHKIDAVVVGADRVTRNGDTANKIGTYQLAVVAKHHNVPFYVCAPTTSIDLSLAEGKDIPIEERPPTEMTEVAGVRIASPDDDDLDDAIAQCESNPEYDIDYPESEGNDYTPRSILRVSGHSTQWQGDIAGQTSSTLQHDFPPAASFPQPGPFGAQQLQQVQTSTPPQTITILHPMQLPQASDITPKRISCWNPAFDVTPAELITGGIVTELGVFKPAELYDRLRAQKV